MQKGDATLNFDIQKIKKFLLNHMPLWMYRLRSEFREFCYRIKYAYQRAKRGYSDLDWFDIDLWFIHTMPRLLRELLNHFNTFPEGYGDVESVEDWKKILREMITCLENMDEDKVAIELEQTEPDCIKAYEQTLEIVESNKNKFFELFSKYFWCLWD